MFDTLKFNEELKKSGFIEKQAKGLTSCFTLLFKQIQNIGEDQELPSKQDLKILEKEIDLKIEKTRSDLSIKIEQSRNSLLHWIIGTISGQTIIIIGSFFAIIKLN